MHEKRHSETNRLLILLGLSLVSCEADAVTKLNGRIEIKAECERPDGEPIDISQVYLFEGQRIQETPRSKYHYETNGDKLLIRDTKDSSNYVIYNIASIVSESRELGTDLDIVVRPAYYDKQIVFYWRETFANRSYLNGVIHVVKGEPVEICSGRRGVDRRD